MTLKRTVQSGAMRHQVDVVDRVEAGDGSGGLPTSDDVLETVWCSIDQVREQVIDDFGRIDNVNIYRIRARYSPLIDEDKKLVFGGRVLEILTVEDVLQLGRELDIRAVEGKP